MPVLVKAEQHREVLQKLADAEATNQALEEKLRALQRDTEAQLQAKDAELELAVHCSKSSAAALLVQAQAECTRLQAEKSRDAKHIQGMQARFKVKSQWAAVRKITSAHHGRRCTRLHCLLWEWRRQVDAQVRVALHQVHLTAWARVVYQMGSVRRLSKTLLAVRGAATRTQHQGALRKSQELYGWLSEAQARSSELQRQGQEADKRLRHQALRHKRELQCEIGSAVLRQLQWAVNSALNSLVRRQLVVWHANSCRARHALCAAQLEEARVLSSEYFELLKSATEDNKALRERAAHAETVAATTKSQEELTREEHERAMASQDKSFGEQLEKAEQERHRLEELLATSQVGLACTAGINQDMQAKAALLARMQSCMRVVLSGSLQHDAMSGRVWCWRANQQKETLQQKLSQSRASVHEAQNTSAENLEQLHKLSTELEFMKAECASLRLSLESKEVDTAARIQEQVEMTQRSLQQAVAQGEVDAACLSEFRAISALQFMATMKSCLNSTWLWRVVSALRCWEAAWRLHCHLATAQQHRSEALRRCSNLTSRQRQGMEFKWRLRVFELMVSRPKAKAETMTRWGMIAQWRRATRTHNLRLGALRRLGGNLAQDRHRMVLQCWAAWAREELESQRRQRRAMSMLSTISKCSRIQATAQSLGSMWANHQAASSRVALQCSRVCSVLRGQLQHHTAAGVAMAVCNWEHNRRANGQVSLQQATVAEIHHTMADKHQGIAMRLLRRWCSWLQGWEMRQCLRLWSLSAEAQMLEETYYAAMEEALMQHTLLQTSQTTLALVLRTKWHYREVVAARCVHTWRGHQMAEVQFMCVVTTVQAVERETSQRLHMVAARSMEHLIHRSGADSLRQLFLLWRLAPPMPPENTQQDDNCREANPTKPSTPQMAPPASQESLMAADQAKAFIRSAKSQTHSVPVADIPNQPSSAIPVPDQQLAVVRSHNSALKHKLEALQKKQTRLKRAPNPV